MSTNKWQKKFLEAGTENSCGDLSIMISTVSDIIRQEREALLKEIMDLSDKIEMEGHTEFNEWRAFKCFRNTLRDKYLEKKI